MTTTTATRPTRNNRPWALARAAVKEEWAWAHPQDIRGVSERLLREDLGDAAAERLLRSAAAAAARAASAAAKAKAR